MSACRGCGRRGRLQLDHSHIMLQAAVDGLGFAVTALSLLGTDVAQGRLACPLPGRHLPLQPLYYGCAPGTGRETQLFADWLDGRRRAPPGRHVGASGTCRWEQERARAGGRRRRQYPRVVRLRAVRLSRAGHGQAVLSLVRSARLAGRELRGLRPGLPGAAIGRAGCSAGSAIAGDGARCWRCPWSPWAVPTFLMGLLPDLRQHRHRRADPSGLPAAGPGASPPAANFPARSSSWSSRRPARSRGLYGSVANAAAMGGRHAGHRRRLAGHANAVGGSDAGLGLAHSLPHRNSRPAPSACGRGSAVPDSPAFAELSQTAALEPTPVRAAIRSQWRQMALGAGLNWVASAGYYLVFVWFVSNMTDIIGPAVWHRARHRQYRSRRWASRHPLPWDPCRTGWARAAYWQPVRWRPRPAPSPLLMLAATGSVAAALAAQCGLAVLVAVFLGTLPAVVRVAAWRGGPMHGALARLQRRPGAIRRYGASRGDACWCRRRTGDRRRGLYLVVTALVCGALASSRSLSG